VLQSLGFKALRRIGKQVRVLYEPVTVSGRRFSSATGYFSGKGKTIEDLSSSRKSGDLPLGYIIIHLTTGGLVI